MYQKYGLVLSWFGLMLVVTVVAVVVASQVGMVRGYLRFGQWEASPP
jgi:hypothetical protein